MDAASTAARVCFVAALLALLAGAGKVRAQEGCRFGEGSLSFQVVTLAGGDQITYMSRPHFVCAGGVEIWADSAVAYSGQSFSQFMGNVRYVDESRDLQADEARYFSQQARLQASGNLLVRDTVRGSVIEHGDLVYLRQASFRDEEEMTVTTGMDRVRPQALLYMGQATDTATEEGAEVPPPVDTEQTPYRVVGDRLFLVGDRYFEARGDVEIERDSLHAFGNQAEYDQEAGRILLEGDALVDGSDYDLTGRTIDIDVPGGEIRSVRAIRDGLLTGDRLELTAPSITLFLAEGVMDRLVATPLRADPESADEPVDSADLVLPVAVAEDFRLTADSVDVVAPAQALDRIFAVGGARSESTARDSLNVGMLPEIALKDWLEGDTIIAVFLPEDSITAAAADTGTAAYRLDRIMAHGNARSLYRLLPSDSASRKGIDPPAVHYVTGTRILIVMARGDVDRMEVEGPTTGWHLEPEGMRIATDSTAVPDTSRIGPDTTPLTPRFLTSAVRRPDLEPGPHPPGRIDAVWLRRGRAGALDLGRERR
jgi:lipopolysaccharide export system protein LptA